MQSGLVVSGSVLVRSPSITAAATTMIIVTLTEHKNRVKVVVPGRGAEELELGCWCNYERRRAQVLSPAWPPLLLLSTKFRENFTNTLLKVPTKAFTLFNLITNYAKQQVFNSPLGSECMS